MVKNSEINKQLVVIFWLVDENMDQSCIDVAVLLGKFLVKLITWNSFPLMDRKSKKIKCRVLESRKV